MQQKFVTQNQQLPVTAFNQAINRLYNNNNKMDNVNTTLHCGVFA